MLFLVLQLFIIKFLLIKTSNKVYFKEYYKQIKIKTLCVVVLNQIQQSNNKD